MTRDEKKAFMKEIKALKKKEKSGAFLTIEELQKLTEYYNDSAAKLQVATFVIISINILIILAWLVVKLVLFAN